MLPAVAVVSTIVSGLNVSAAAPVRWETGAGTVVFNPESASVVGLDQSQRELGVEGDSGCRIFAVRMWPAEKQPFGNASQGPGHGWENSESVAIPDDEWELVASVEGSPPDARPSFCFNIHTCHLSHFSNSLPCLHINSLFWRVGYSSL